MNAIQTIHGMMDLSSVDFILPHEHVLIDMTHEAVAPKRNEERARFEGPVTMETLGLLRRNPYVVRSNLILDNTDLAASELHALRAHGRGLLVDVTTVGLGRDVRRVQKIAEKADLPVAVGCGFFTHDSVPKQYLDWEADRIGDMLLNEIFCGIDDTDIIPGVIGEIGVSESIAPFERRSLLGAAMAQRESGLPLYLHTYPWSRAGLEAVQLLLDAGVEPDRICVCHLDVAFHPEYLHEVLNAGVYVEFDNFGKEFYFSPQEGSFAGGPFETDRDRVSMLIKLVREGYGSQLMLANDVCLKAMLCAYGGWGYGHVHENILSMLADRGLPEETTNRLFLKNPQAFLARKQGAKGRMF